MAKKSNYVFPIERNTALEVLKIIKNFYLLEGASGEELLEKRKGLSTKLLLGGLAEDVFTQELLNEIYANINNEEVLISLIKDKFQSVDYESALFLLRWTKDSQSPYYPRMQGDKPVEQFNEDYEFAKNLLIAYINDHGLTSIKNLPGRVIRVQKDLIKEMANGFRSVAIDEARKTLTSNQEALVELRASIKEQKQKIADLKAANPDAQTQELELKLKEDRQSAIEKYKVVKGQRRSLRDTLEERAILNRDFSEVVGGRTISKAQFDAEREEHDEKLSLLKKVLDIVKKAPNTFADITQTMATVTLNIKGKFNEKEIKELLGEDTEDNTYTSPTQNQYVQNDEIENNLENNQDYTSNGNYINDNNDTNQEQINNNSDIQEANTSNEVTNAIQTEALDNTTTTNNMVDNNSDSNTDNITSTTTTDTSDNTGDNGQEMFNQIYNEALEETESQEQQNQENNIQNEYNQQQNFQQVEQQPTEQINQTIQNNIPNAQYQQTIVPNATSNNDDTTNNN